MSKTVLQRSRNFDERSVKQAINLMRPHGCAAEDFESLCSCAEYGVLGSFDAFEDNLPKCRGFLPGCKFTPAAGGVYESAGGFIHGYVEACIDGRVVEVHGGHLDYTSEGCESVSLISYEECDQPVGPGPIDRSTLASSNHGAAFV